MSCLRANYVPFPISPRNSAAAVAHLMFKAGVSHLLIGHEPAMADIAKHALEIFKDQFPDSTVPDVSLVPLFDDLFLPAVENLPGPGTLPYEYMGPDATALIAHSSGATLHIISTSPRLNPFHRFNCVPQAHLLDKSPHH
jgi:acyl-CoA synthetase (AMP-forming)/AMP-acid ligase II